MYVTLIAVAALWGAGAGLLVPRAAYRLSVEPEEPWRGSCPAGHPFTGPARGWLGGGRCGSCRPDGGAPAAGGTESPATSDPGTGSPAADTGPPAPSGSRSPAPSGSRSPAPGSPDAGAPVSASPPGGPDTGPPVPALRTAERARLAPLLTALPCAALAAATGPRPELAVWLLLVPFAVLLAVVDRRVHRLPDQLTLPLAAVAAVLLGAVSPLPGTGGSWSTALLGGLVLGASYLALFLINPNGLGFGDVKLALSLGVVLGWYGWSALFTGAFAGFLLGSLYGIGLMALGRAGRGTAIPFGPFMIGGALAGLLLGALTANA
ncbi:prepilin peptidase [Streptomyces sp. NPDC051018]|uniref:prepilin peptidase n=1 Tax=Streptomyces sp. NPDC051018 TaxID=3365639 RepID=UPI00379770CB